MQCSDTCMDRVASYVSFLVPAICVTQVGPEAKLSEPRFMDLIELCVSKPLDAKE